MSNNEICVADGALAADAEAGGSVAPGVGDEIDFTGRGKVTRAENGQVYFTATEINGQPVMGAAAGEPEAPTDEAALDEEVKGLQEGGGMAGLLLVLLALWLSGSFARGADLQFARGAVFSGGQVSNWVAATSATQAFSVEIDNQTGGTLYLLIFDSATNSLAGRAVQFPAVPITTGLVGYKDWNAAGAPMRFGVNVCLSTTPYSLTNASAGGAAAVIHSPTN